MSNTTKEALERLLAICKECLKEESDPTEVICSLVEGSEEFRNALQDVLGV